MYSWIIIFPLNVTSLHAWFAAAQLAVNCERVNLKFITQTECGEDAQMWRQVIAASHLHDGAYILSYLLQCFIWNISKSSREIVIKRRIMLSALYFALIQTSFAR